MAPTSSIRLALHSRWNAIRSDEGAVEDDAAHQGRVLPTRRHGEGISTLHPKACSGEYQCPASAPVDMLLHSRQQFRRWQCHACGRPPMNAHGSHPARQEYDLRRAMSRREQRNDRGRGEVRLWQLHHAPRTSRPPELQLHSQASARPTQLSSWCRVVPWH